MSVIDTVKLLEQRTEKAASLISMLRKEKASLQQQLEEAESRPKFNPAMKEELDTVKAANEQLTNDVAQEKEQNGALQSQLAELQAQLASLHEQFNELQRKYDELQQNYFLVDNHNAELSDYVSKMETSNKLVEESINAAMKNLDQVEGLDDLPLGGLSSASDLEIAEDFTNGGALANAEVVDDDLLADTPEPAPETDEAPAADTPADDDLPIDAPLPEDGENL